MLAMEQRMAVWARAVAAVRMAVRVAAACGARRYVRERLSGKLIATVADFERGGAAEEEVARMSLVPLSLLGAGWCHNGLLGMSQCSMQLPRCPVSSGPGASPPPEVHTRGCPLHHMGPLLFPCSTRFLCSEVNMLTRESTWGRLRVNILTIGGQLGDGWCPWDSARPCSMRSTRFPCIVALYGIEHRRTCIAF